MEESVQITHFNKVIHLMEMNRFNDAIKEIEGYIQLYPQDSDGYGMLGKIYLSKNDYKKALHWANEAIKIDPDSYLGWQVKVGACYQGEDWKNFDHTIKSALEIYPEESYYYFLDGNRLNQKGKYKESQAVFEKAVELEPYNALYIANLAYTYALLHDFERAIACEKSALALEVESDTVFLYLGWAAGRRGDYEQAIEYLTNAVRLDPQDEQVRKEYLLMLQNKYKIYRFFTFPSRLKTWQWLIMWFVGWIIFKPLLVLFIILYVLSHWTTKLIVHVKVFGWSFNRK